MPLGGPSVRFLARYDGDVSEPLVGRQGSRRCTAQWFSYVYIYIYFFRLFSFIGYYKILSIILCTKVDPCWLFILYIAVYQFLLTLFLWNHLIFIYETHEQVAWQNCLFQSVISDSYELFPNCLSIKAPGLKVLYYNRRDMNKWPKIRNLKGNVDEFFLFWDLIMVHYVL